MPVGTQAFFSYVNDARIKVKGDIAEITYSWINARVFLDTFKCRSNNGKSIVTGLTREK
jgi:hypothetical protein